MSARKLAYLAVGVSITVCLCSFGLANALETKYHNKVPYSALFQAKPDKIMVQRSDGSKVVQAVIPINEKEEKVEPQTIKETKGD